MAMAMAMALALIVGLAACSSSGGSEAAGSSTTGPVATRSPSASTTVPPKVRASSGCGVAPAVRGLTSQAPGDVALTFASGEVQRSYRLGIPDSYDRARPAPLILDLHGSGSTGAQQSLYSDLSRRAAARGIITVTPDAIDHQWQLGPKGTDDDFLVALVHAIESRYCVNLDRVDVAGLSLGSWKAAVMACVHPDVFAAAGLVAVEVHPKPCRPMPVIAFHGTADHVVPYGEGADPGVVVHGFNADLPGARENIASWAEDGHCSTQAQVRTIGTDVVRWTYAGCASGVDVQLYTVLHGDHTWPGSAITIGPTTHTIDATNLILDFFQAHPLRNPHP